MSSEPGRWERVATLFRQCIKLEDEARARFLAEVRAEDEALFLELRELLEHDARDEDSLEPPNPGELEEDLAAREVGRRIGPWQLEEVLGRGGMSTVYRARRTDKEYEQLAAVKLVRRGMDTEDILRRFRMERQVLADLHHPGIAHLLDGGATEEGRPYLVMEYVQGVPVDRYCEEQSFDVEERLRLFLSICEAVQHAHGHGVVHRDLKPSNILVTTEGLPKLLDFGIAKVLDTTPSATTATVTATELRLMTPEYASPEQVRGRAIGPGSDVYSLGVVLYELLSGHRPYRLTTRLRHELERAICELDPPRPSTVVGDKPDSRRLRAKLAGDLDTIVLKAMEKEHDRRYESAEALRRDINRFLTGTPITARPPSLWYHLRMFARRRPALVTGVAVGVLLLVVGIVVSSILLVRSELAVSRLTRETESVNAINKFLTDMMSSVRLDNQFSTNIEDPLVVANEPREQGQWLKLRGMLRYAIPRVDAAFEGKPLLEAEARVWIGKALCGAGFPMDAKPQFELALDLYGANAGQDDPRVLELEVELAALLLDCGFDKEPLSILSATHRAMRRVHGEDNPRTLVTARHLANALSKNGRLEESEQLLDETLESQRRVFGPEHSETMHTRLRRADLWLHQNRLMEASSEAEAILEFCGSNLEIGRYVRTLARIALGLCRLRSFDHESAVEELGAELEGSIAVYGHQHPYTLALMEAFGLSLVQPVYETFHPCFLGFMQIHGLPRGDDAPGVREPMFLRAMGGWRSMSGDTIPAALGSLMSYAEFLEAEGRFDEVEGLFRERMVRCEKGASKGENEWNHAFLDSLRRVARVALNRGKVEDGERLYRGWVAAHARIHGEDATETLEAALTAGFALRHSGREEAAGDLRDQALSAATRIVEKGDPDARHLDVLAGLLLSSGEPELGQIELAIQHAEHAVSISGENSIAALGTLSQAYSGAGRSEDALDTARALISRQPSWETQDRWAAERQLLLLLAKQEDAGQARRFLEDTYSRFREIVGTKSVPHLERSLEDSWALVSAGHHALAQPLAEECLRLSNEDHWQGRGWRAGLARVLLGRCLTAAGSHEEAETLLREGYLQIKNNPLVAAERQHLAAQWMAELYDEIGDVDRADRWRVHPPDENSAERRDSPINLDEFRIPVQGEVVFWDDFEDGNSERWAWKGPGIGYVGNGRLNMRCTEGEPAVRLEASDPSWRDFLLEFDICLVYGSHRFMSIGQTPFGDGSLVLIWTKAGEMRLSPITDMIRVGPSKYGEWHRIGLLTRGTRVRVHVDGEEVLACDVPRIPEGRFCLDGGHGIYGFGLTQYDNVRVTLLEDRGE